MEGIHEHTNTNENKSVTSTLISEMDDSSTEIIYHEALQDSGNLATNAEWSETSSTFSPSSSYSHINTETYKECCANPSDTLKNKKDFMIVESPVNVSNSKIYDTNSICKITHFQKSHKPYSSNSHVFENIIVNDSEMEITQNSVCLNRFRKRRKLSSPNGEVFVEINKSNNNGMNSVEVSMTSPKFLSKKIKDLSYFNMPDYNLSTTDSTNDLITADDSNVSDVKKSTALKKPSDSSLVNDCTYNVMDESKTELLTRKFTKKTIDTVNSAFDNIINDSSITSDNLSNITKTLNDTAVSNVNKNESCSTMELPSLNHTYDIPAIGNSTQIPLLSQSVGNISEMHNKSITRPINETYTLENDLMPNKTNNNVSSSVNLKNTHSNTYTNENNSNGTLNQPKSMNKTINTLADMSNIYNQSKSSERKPNFIRKFQLDTVSQDYNNIIIEDGNSTINDTLNNTENNKFKRFKLKKTCHDGNSNIFDNIISSSQRNEKSVSQNTNISNDNISNTLNYSAKSSNTNDLCNISSKSKSEKNIVESIDKTLPHQPNVILEKDVETSKNMNYSDVFLKKSSSSLELSGKFNFSKRFKRLSQSFQENSINFEVIRQHSISMNNDFNKTLGEKSVIFNISANKCNDQFDSNSQNFDIQKDQTNIKMVQQFSEPISSVPIENDKHEHSTFNLSQSQTPHFTGKHTLTAHSGVFNDLVDHSLNSSDTSLNISKQVKFKNYKNVHDRGQSIIFENVIKSSQESNLTLSQNKTLSNTVLYDQSIVQGDEISMFANVEDLLSDSKSLKRSDQFLQKVDTSQMLNINESKHLEDELNITTSDSTLKHSLEKKDSNGLNISAVNDKLHNSTRSMSSVIGNNTLREKNNSLRSDESVNNHSLSNITAGLLENDGLTSLTSKNSVVSNNINLSSICNETFGDHNSNTSNHSSIISKNENLTLNSIPGPSEQAKSQENQSKTSRSDLSTSSTSYDEGLTLFTTGLLESDKSLESNMSSRNETNRDLSKNSLISTSTNEESTLLNMTSESLESNMSSKNETNRDLSKNSLISTSTNEESTLLNTTSESLESSRSSRNESNSDSSKNSLISTSTNEESTLLYTTSESLESNRSSRTQSNNLVLSNYSTRSASKSERLIKLSTSTKSSAQNVSSVSKSKASTSKDYYLLEDISNVSNKSLMSENNKTNVSRISTRSSKQSKDSLENVEQELFNAEELPDNGGFTILNTTARSSEQNISSSSQPKASTSKDYSSHVNAKDVSNVSSKSLMPENNTYNVSRIFTRSSKQSKDSLENVEQELFNAEELSNNGGLTILSTTARPSKQNVSSNSQPKASTSNDYSTHVDAKDVLNVSSKSTRSSKQSKTLLPFNEGLATTNITARSSDKIVSSISQPKASISKNYSSYINAKDVSNVSSKSLMPENKTYNVSRMSTRSSNQSKDSLENVEQEQFNAEELPDNEGLTTNTTARSFKQNISSISQPKASISTRSSKQSKDSLENVEQELFNAEELSDNEGLTTTNTTTRSSKQNISSISQPKASISKDYSSYVNAKDVSNVSSKSLMPENKTYNVSRMSTRSSNQSKDSLENVEQEQFSAEELPDNEGLTTNTTARSSKQNISSISQPKASISTRSSKQSKDSLENVEQELFNAEELSDNEGLTTTNTTTRSSKQNISSISQPKASISKDYSSYVNAKDVSNVSSKSLMPENKTYNVSRMSTRSSNQSKDSLENVEQEQFSAEELPDNEGLTTNTTARSSKQNISSISQPKASISKDYSSYVNAKDVSNVSSKSLMPENNTTNVSRISTRLSKQSKDSLENVEQELFNAEGLTTTNITARSSKQNISSISQPKASISKDYSSHVNAKDISNVSSKSLMPENNTTNVSRISTRLSKQSKYSLNNVEQELYNGEELPDNGGFTILNITARSSEQNVSSSSKPKASTSKDYSSRVNAKNVSNVSSKSLMPENNTTNVSRISTHSSKQNKDSLDNVEQELFNAEELQDNGQFTILNTTARSSEQNVSSSSQPKASTSKDYSSHVDAEDISNVSSKSTRSSKQSKSSLNNTPTILKMTNGLMKHKKSTSTRVTRSSSLASTVNKSLLKRTLIGNKSMLSENNGNYISTRSYRTLNSSAKSNNETGNHCTDDDDSIFWKTIPDNTTCKPFYNINAFETPRNNKLALAEQIINTIGIMSVNKHRATHPGVFELEEHRPTRLTTAYSFNQTPSILTKVLAGNNFNKTMFDPESLTETLIDSSHVVEKTVITKFKSLYNKEAWITKRLYNFLVSKLLPKYSIYSVKYAEKFIKYLVSIMKQVSDEKADLQLCTDVLRYHMARYGIINDTFDYMGFLTDYIPFKYFKKLMPNNIPNANNTSVKFDQNKNFIPIMNDEEFLNQVLNYLNAA